jgi:Spy/CpxP family protein refolding chaperone
MNTKIIFASGFAAHGPNEGSYGPLLGGSMKIFAGAALWVFVVVFVAFARAADQPYAGQKDRSVKELSDQEIADYLQGHGMGLSKVAELNHYPGPRHVLDQADDLRLSTEQLAKAKAIWELMDTRARALGEMIVEKEGALERMYSKGAATPADTRAVVDEIARLQADLRYTHLVAHLSMRSVLSTEQVAKYDELRGYSDAAVTPTEHHLMQHHGN